MKFRIFSEVSIAGIGKVKHEHVQEFSDDSNVFGRALEYRECMRRMFRGCEFRIVRAEKI